MATMTVTGSLPRDAELKDFNGKHCLKFTVPYKVGFGDKKQTVWTNCSLWGPRAASLAKYMTKGSVVEASGTPSVRAYDKNGPQAALELNVNDVVLHGGGKKDEAPSDAQNDDKIPF